MKKALFVAWRTRDPDHPGWGPVGRLEFEEGIYRFFYTHGAQSLPPGFQPFAQMDDLEQVYESTELFPLFANRLLSERRPEYDAYLRWSGFEHANPPDPMTILAVTEGQRQTDAVEVFPCPVPGGLLLEPFFLTRRPLGQGRGTLVYRRTIARRRGVAACARTEQHIRPLRSGHLSTA